MMKIYVVGGGNSYFRFFSDIKEGSQNILDLNEADLVVFTGGEDVSPKYYNESNGRQTYTNPERDSYEYKIFNAAVEQRKRIVGVCRGFQAIHAFQGFPLIQHMSGHNNCSHIIKSNDGSFAPFDAPGDHHQNPICVDRMQLIGYSERRSPFYLNGNDDDYKFASDYKEVEIGYYPEINALGFQYHPEWSSKSSECWEKSLEIVKNVLR